MWQSMYNHTAISRRGPSWPWSYGSWIYNFLCNQCLSPLMLWVQISTRARWTTLCDKVCQWLEIGRLFSPGPPVSSTNKTYHQDITEILLKVALNTIKQTKKHWLIMKKTQPSNIMDYACTHAGPYNVCNLSLGDSIIVLLFWMKLVFILQESCKVLDMERGVSYTKIEKPRIHVCSVNTILMIV